MLHTIIQNCLFAVRWSLIITHFSSRLSKSSSTELWYNRAQTSDIEECITYISGLEKDLIGY